MTNDDLKFNREIGKQIHSKKETNEMEATMDVSKVNNKSEAALPKVQEKSVYIDARYNKTYTTEGVKKLLVKQFVLGAVTTLGVMLIILLSTIIYFMNNEIETLNKVVDKSASIMQQQDETIQETSNELNTVIALNEELSVVNEQSATLLAEFQQREYLFDEYEYALMKTSTKRTDLTYKELKKLVEWSSEKGINPHLPLAMMKLESGFDRDATNSRSTARGYGQILGSTGNMLYTKMLGRSGYNHNMAFDGELNIEMIIAYIDYLLKSNNGDVDMALTLYSGNDIGRTYHERVNNTLIQYGNTNIDKLTREYRSNRS
jgi:soluble lytic murein transglycosylase-like protein